MCSRRWARRARCTAGTGSGLAVQAYQKRALPVLEWLWRTGARAGAAHSGAPGERCLLGHGDQARRREGGSPTIRCSRARSRRTTSYLACARTMLAARDAIYPQFATHNAHTHRRIDVGRGQHGFRISATAWHGRGVVRISHRSETARIARQRQRASMRRSETTRTCSPISCAACSRTAPTPHSSTGLPTRRRPSTRSSADPVEKLWRHSSPGAIRAFRCRPICCPIGRIRPDSSGAIPRSRRRR